MSRIHRLRASDRKAHGNNSMPWLPTLMSATVSFLPIATGLASVACRNQTASTQRQAEGAEQVLPLTYGGFLKGGPENEKLDDVCSTDSTRNLLDCDIYNGLPGWTITEVTLAVTWDPYGVDDLRYFKVPVTIPPKTTQHVSLRVGVQLPTDEVVKVPHREPQTTKRWGWHTVRAKGRPAK
jgi:hypothetical protein